VKVNKDSPGQQTLSGPAINTKNVQTQVLVENGGTVVLGGIFEQEERTTETKVPLLGDIPVVGYLFKTTSRTSDRKELLIFITPARRDQPGVRQVIGPSAPNCLKAAPIGSQCQCLISEILFAPASRGCHGTRPPHLRLPAR